MARKKKDEHKYIKWFLAVAAAGVVSGLAYAYVEKFLKQQNWLKLQAQQIQSSNCSGCSQAGSCAACSRKQTV